MTQPPNQPAQSQPWMTGSSQSATQPEETRQLPPHGQNSAGQPYAGAYSQPASHSTDNPYVAPPTDPYAQPQSQQTAAHSWDLPPSQPQSQPQPQPQQTAAPSWNQPPAGPPTGSSFGTWQPQQYQPPAQWQHQPQSRKRFADANPLRAAFDFRFNSYATPGLVKIIYTLAAIIAGLWWIGGGLTALIAGIAARNLGGGGASLALGILGLLLGWIPALLWLLFIRIILEASLALVRIADDARNIRTKLEE